MVFTVQGLLSSPLVNLGTGLLASAFDDPRNFGQALGRGLSLGQGFQGRALQNDFIRERIRDASLARGAQERRQNAVSMLQSRLQGDDTQGPLTQQETIGLLADISPGLVAQGLLSRALPPTTQPTRFQRDFAFLRSLGISEDEALQSLKRGTTVNVGNQDKPLSVSDLRNTRLPDNSIPPIGTTPKQLREAGGVVLTNEQQKGLEAAGKFKPVLDRLEKLALSEGGVFSNIEPGFGNRVNAAFDLFIGSVTRDNPNVSAYEDLAEGTLAPIIKALGESGALAEGDVQRGLGLLPRVRDQLLLPDTREDAVAKFNDLRKILERGERNLRKKLRSGNPPPATSASPSQNTGRIVDFNSLAR